MATDKKTEQPTKRRARHRQITAAATEHGGGVTRRDRHAGRLRSDSRSRLLNYRRLRVEQRHSPVQDLQPGDVTKLIVGGSLLALVVGPIALVAAG